MKQKRGCVAKTTVRLVSEVPLVVSDDTEVINLKSLNAAQKDYFMEAWSAFERNISCWDFDGPFFFNSSSQYHTLVLEWGKELFKHPLELALVALWLALGVNQGQMASKKDKTIYLVM